MLYLCPFVVFGSAERQLPKSCEENNLMNKRTLHRLFSVLMALVMAVSLLTGCGTKTAENVEKQEDAQTIQVICGVPACTKPMRPISSPSCRM